MRRGRAVLRALALVAMLTVAGGGAAAQSRLPPILDMHMHARTAAQIARHHERR